MCIHTITAFTCGHKSLDFAPTTPLCGLSTTICASQLPPLEESVESHCDECLWPTDVESGWYKDSDSETAADKPVEKEDFEEDFEDFDSTFVFESDIEVLDRVVETDYRGLFLWGGEVGVEAGA